MNIIMKKTVDMHYRWDNPVTLHALEKAFESNQVVVSSTDTVLGLLAPLTKTGFESLNCIKGRTDKPYIVLLGCTSLLPLYCSVPFDPRIELLMQECWPGPLTLLLPANPAIDQFLQSSGTIAIRIPNHKGLLSFLGTTKGAFSTSANLAGNPVPESPDQLDPHILEKTTVLVYDTKEQSKVASTILDCTTKQVLLVREGHYPISKIEKICGKIVY